MDKKGQGMSLNVVIVAIVVLVVLVVLVMIFTGYFSKWTPGIQACSNQGGQCTVAGTCKDPFDTTQNGRTITASCPDVDSDPDTDEVCCLGQVIPTS